MEMVFDAKSASPSALRDLAKHAAGGAAAFGGALIVAGAWLPWFSLYAGLHPLRGISALNGRILLAGGAVALLMGLALLVRDHRRLRRLLGALGIGLALFAAWILMGVPETYRTMQENPMLVARVGPGLFVAMFGALIVVAAPFIKRPSSDSPGSR